MKAMRLKTAWSGKMYPGYYGIALVDDETYAAYTSRGFCYADMYCRSCPSTTCLMSGGCPSGCRP